MDNKKKKNPFERAETYKEIYFYTDSNGYVYEEFDRAFLQDDLRYKVANYCADKELMMQRALHETLNRLLWRFSMENGGDVKPWNGYTYHYYIYKPFNSNDPWTAWRVDGKDLGVVYFSSEDIARRAMVEIVIPFMEKHPEFVW